MGDVRGEDVRGLEPELCVAGVLRPPGSKSIAIRTLLSAALAEGETVLAGLPPGEDVAACRAVVEALGVGICEEGDGGLRVRGRSPAQGSFLRPEVEVPCGESGTLARLATAVLAFCGEPGSPARVGASGTLLRRSSEPLLEVLSGAGVGLEPASDEGSWPLELVSAAPPPTLLLQAPVSSQELSGLLVASAAHTSGPGGRTVLVMGGLPSEPYARMTAGVLQRFGARVAHEGSEWRVWGPLKAPAGILSIETDASGAAVALAAACLSGGRVRVPGFEERSFQGDLRCVEHLQAFGCRVEREGDELRAEGFPTRAARLDLAGEPDLAPVLAAVAGAFALRGGTGVSHLTGLETLNGKESRRVEVLAGGLRALGLSVEDTDQELRIAPGAGAASDDVPLLIDPEADHRMAFAFGLLGLVRRNLRVSGASCVAKSWPAFWEALGAG